MGSKGCGGFSFFSQVDGFCPLKFFDTTHCQHFGCTSLLAFFSGATTVCMSVMYVCYFSLIGLISAL